LPRDGSGTYTRPLGTTPVDGDTILAANYNSAIDDIATALTGSVPRDGSAAMTGPLTLPGDPSTALQAAPKQYVDNAVSSLASGAFKSPVRAATTANITLSGTQTIDGVALVADDRVLVKNQTTASGNGIYLVKVGAWVRATDFDAWSEIFGTSVIVDQGSTQADTVWICTANAGGTLGTTAITFAQMQGQIADGTLALARLVNAGGASRLIGRGSSGGGAWQEITLGAGLSMVSQVLSATASGIIDYQAFTTAGAGTWTKPAGATANDLVVVTMWAGGGGGGSAGGGGGGAFGLLLIPAGSLGATVSVSIGAGGAAGSAGGNTSFSGLTVFGGGAGGGAGAGGGGGALSAGGSNGGAGGGPLGGANAAQGGANSGAGGGGSAQAGGGTGGASFFGGGGGSATGQGGASFFGGGGGGASAGGSVLGGAGGGTGVAGTQPSGGGGLNAAGATGLMRVWTLRVG
jgi:hypothetical protein